MIESDLAELIDDDGGLFHGRVGKQPSQQCGLAASKKARQDGDRKRFFGNSAVIVACFLVFSAHRRVPFPMANRSGQRTSSAARGNCRSAQITAVNSAMAPA